MLAGFALAVLAGCDGDDPAPADPVPKFIASIHGWTRVTDPAGDAFADQRPPGVACDDTGYGLEQLGLSFEVNTGLCDYLTVAQPTMEALEPGDVVVLRMWHDELQAPTPAQGYLGVALEGRVVWHTTVAIPSPYDTLDGEFTVDRELPEGTELQYHVHNHGINTWNLLDIETAAKDEP